MCMHVCICKCVYVCVYFECRYLEDQKGTFDPLELELHKAESPNMTAGNKTLLF